jgi:hypothetical protein
VLPFNHWGDTCEPADLPPGVTAPHAYARRVAARYADGIDPADLGPFCN